MWKELKRFDSTNKTVPCVIDGQANDADIARLFANKYQNLFTSVPTHNDELKELMNDINRDILLGDVSERKADISVSDVCKAITRLKHEKSDGLYGTYSDHFINCSHKMKVHIALMLTAMQTHGYTPDNFLDAVLTSIPKDTRGDLCDSENYRGIALCSILCKVFDIVIIDKYGTQLNTSDMQFAFKSDHSTSLCTGTLKEVCSHYVHNNSDAFVCMLDASKAFDRVHIGKLFSLLKKRKLPAVTIRLLLDMYTKQRMCTRWNGVMSEPFPTLNGVKQGGVLSPILFCVYIDELLDRVNASGLGCHIGHMSYAGVGYADDVSLVSPSITALQKLIHICEDFAAEYHITFNVKKTVCIRISGRGRHKAPSKAVTLHGSPIVWKNRVKHLGNILTSDLKDVEDIKLKKSIFISQVNKLNNKFSVLSSNVRAKLLQTYCCAWYGAQTWDLISKSAREMNTEWKKAVRRSLYIPNTTHSNLLPHITKCRSFETQHLGRVSKFLCGIIQSKNTHISLIGQKAMRSCNGAMGRNWVRCLLAGTVVKQGNDFDVCSSDSSNTVGADQDAISVITAANIRELLDVRDGISEMPDFSNHDVCSMLHDMCCNSLT